MRLCADPESCNRVACYTDLSLSAGLRMDEHFLVTFALENLFDAAYKTYASGVYAPGRNFILAMRGTL